jgi:uncharacterized protein YecT (DUF1311 family)
MAVLRFLAATLLAATMLAAPAHAQTRKPTAQETRLIHDCEACDMQRAWIASRDATCEFYYHKIQGSMSVPMTASCLLSETARRALLLAAFGGL